MEFEEELVYLPPHLHLPLQLHLYLLHHITIRHHHTPYIQEEEPGEQGRYKSRDGRQALYIHTLALPEVLYHRAYGIEGRGF